MWIQQACQGLGEMSPSSAAFGDPLKPLGTSNIGGHLCLTKQILSKTSASGHKSIQEVRITPLWVPAYTPMVVPGLSSRLEPDNELAAAPRMLM